MYTKKSNPRAYWIFEVYQDEAAFEKHITAPYGQPFNAELTQMIEEDGSTGRAAAPVRGAPS